MSSFSIHPTPNPDSLKFTFASARIVAQGMISASSTKEANGCAVVEQLLSIDGVANVFATSDFATITKLPSAEWDTVLPHVRGVLSELIQQSS
jgi:hypothetical protein